MKCLILYFCKTYQFERVTPALRASVSPPVSEDAKSHDDCR